MNYKEKYETWLNSSYIDEVTKEELKSISDEKEIEDRFYRDLEFGTGGLRGVIASGTNRMNVYVIRKVSQGLSNYIARVSEEAKKRGIAIAYDSRNKSREFAMEAASVFTGNGINTYLFDELRPTPELSYAVRKLNTISGIVVTASHNPKQYNGYKVYWEDGAQISLDIANEVLDEINKIESFEAIKYKKFDEAIADGSLTIINDIIDTPYINDVQSLLLNKEIINKQSDSFKIIYTPLHGSGNKPVRRSLLEAGFKNVYVVPEQEMPDPSFSTVKSPNPEEHSAFTLAIKMAGTIDPDLILGTDPDCDRLGVCVKNTQGEFVTLTGNQVGALLVDYILSQRRAKNSLPSNGVVIKTIVTSELGHKVAASYNIETIDTLTGFKFIGEKINEFEETNLNTFLFGYEESYGYLCGTFVRDKDAVIASTLVAEMAAYYKENNITLYEALQNLYKRFGYYKEGLKSKTLEGKEGCELILKMMSTLRNNTPDFIGDEKIIEVLDYEKGIKDLPKSNVLQLVTDKGSIISIRPSGTEPKIKIYYSVIGKSNDDSKERLEYIMSKFDTILDTIAK